MAQERLRVLITSFLEEEFVKRIKAVDPRIAVVYEPELLPAPRYVGDHSGLPRELTPSQRERWLGHLAASHVHFDFDSFDPANIMANSPQLRWVQSSSSGVGSYVGRYPLDFDQVRVTTSAGVHAGPLAEFVLMSLLYFTKQLRKMQAWQSAHQWERYTAEALAGKRVGVVGLGNVGCRVAKVLSALDMEVAGIVRDARGPAPQGVGQLVGSSDFDRVIQDLDALVLACPLTEETAKILSRPRVNALPSRAIVVNVGRGGLIDEPALVERLKAGTLGGAALDVTGVEPLPPDSALWDLDNVLISPHSAGTVFSENHAVTSIFVENLRRFLAGEPLKNEFVPGRGY